MYILILLQQSAYYMLKHSTGNTKVLPLILLFSLLSVNIFVDDDLRPLPLPQGSILNVSKRVLILFGGLPKMPINLNSPVIRVAPFPLGVVVSISTDRENSFLTFLRCGN